MFLAISHYQNDNVNQFVQLAACIVTYSVANTFCFSIAICFNIGQQKLKTDNVLVFDYLDLIVHDQK